MKWLLDYSLLHHAMIVVAGRYFWVFPLATLAWLPFVFFDEGAVAAASVQGQLLGVPLTFLAIFLGMRIIAGEINDRTLEIAYTVPGGCERLWITKLFASFLLLLCSLTMLAPLVFLFFTPFPPGALYGAMQGACFYLVLSMAMGTLFRSEASGAIATIVVLAFNMLITGFGDNQLRFTPFFNPYFLADPGAGAGVARSFTSPNELLAWTLQNRIGMLLVMGGIATLAFMRSNRRERMLDGM